MLDGIKVWLTDAGHIEHSGAPGAIDAREIRERLPELWAEALRRRRAAEAQAARREAAKPHQDYTDTVGGAHYPEHATHAVRSCPLCTRGVPCPARISLESAVRS